MLLCYTDQRGMVLVHIIYMNVGLGNQAFQYIFYRWYKKYVPQVDTVVDDGKFFGGDVPHHGYELQRIFGIEVPLLSQRFPADVWQNMVTKRQQGVGIAEQLRLDGMPITVVREQGITNINFKGEIREIASGGALEVDVNKLIYWHGYWLSHSFFNEAKKEVLEDLAFPPFNDSLNLQLQNKINLASEPTAIHVRRGDMVKLGWAARPEYYKNKIKEFNSSHDVSLWLLFSDDIPWCEEHAEELGLLDIVDRLLVVDNNKGNDYWRDVQLMSLCKNRISDRSSFSFLARVLCEYPGKEDVSNWL